MASAHAIRQMAAMKDRSMTEQVIYRPGKDSFRSREITALVDREGSKDLMQGQAQGSSVTVLNDEIEGIPTDPRISDVGTDRIDVAERLGGPRSSRSIQRFADQSPDWVTVEVL